MSKNYDHHWKKGYEKKGIPMGIPTARDAFFAKEAARKRKKAAKSRARKQAVPPPPSPLRIVGRKIEAVRAELAEVAENTGRIEDMVAPILEREGYGGGRFIPGSLATKLLLAGHDIDARLVTRLIAARAELARVVDRERQCRAEYARVAAQERPGTRPATRNQAPARPAVHSLSSDNVIVPPWIGPSAW